MRYALVDADGLVVNAIVWDGETKFDPGEGLTVAKIPDGIGAGPGWTYDGTNWIAPPAEDEELA